MSKEYRIRPPGAYNEWTVFTAPAPGASWDLQAGCPSLDAALDWIKKDQEPKKCEARVTKTSTDSSLAFDLEITCELAAGHRPPHTSRLAFTNDSINWTA